MSSGRKRNQPSEGAAIKKAKVDLNDSPSSEQGISVHPLYEDDFGIEHSASASRYDTESPEQHERRDFDLSPNISFEPGLDIEIDTPAFPLSKPSRESSKQRRRYRGGADSSNEAPQLTKSSTLPGSSRRRNPDKERYSRSHSKSPLPYSTQQSLKSKVLKRNTSSGRNSPLDFEISGDSRHSDRDELYERTRTGGREHSRAHQKQSRSGHRSRHTDSREHERHQYEDKPSYRNVQMSSRDRLGVPDPRNREPHSLIDARHRSIDVGSLMHRKDLSRGRYHRGDDRHSREVSMSSLRQRSSPRRGMEGRDKPLDYRLERDSRREKTSRENKKKKHRHHHRDREQSKSGNTPVAATHESSDEDGREGVELMPEKIEDLIKDIEQSSSDSSGDSSVGEGEQTNDVKSPDSIQSNSPPDDSESKGKGSVDEEQSGENGPEATEESDLQRESDSEGEVHSPTQVPPQLHVMRSRFDTSDHSDTSDEDRDTNQPQSQQEHPPYSGYLEELSESDSEVSVVESPKPMEDVKVDPPTPEPSRSPSPELPPYLPGLMGCKNVESYEWLDRIEEGTYGVVYKAKDKKTGEIVALKKLKMEKEKEGFPITSLREINMLLKAEHPNIVPVREIVVGSNMDKIYIVMDFIKHDLKALMSTMKEKFLEGEVKTLMIHLLRAVHHMHDNWILHRDLKTSNLLLSHENILKVADFGLAREYGSPLLNYTPIVVTLWYRSPELLLGAKEYSTAIDVWSVGCIFAELLLHKPLFTGRSEIDQLNKIFTELGTPNEKIWPGFGQLSGAKNVTFTHHPQGNLRKKYPSLTTQNGFDLFFKLLTYDPKSRITAKEALEHAYFKEMPRPVPPEMFPTWPTKSEIAKSKRKREKSPTPPEGGVFILKGGGDKGSPGAGFSLKF